MGNTNLPQFGAIGTRNSRDTLVGDDQLTEEQKKQRDARKHGVGPAPGRPANAPERVPGQDRDPALERPAKKKSHKQAGASGRSEREALGGHANTGHSPSDAS